MIPRLGRCPRGRNNNLLQYSYLGNPIDRGTWRAIVHRVTESWTRLSMQARTTVLTYYVTKTYKLKYKFLNETNGEGNGNPLQYSFLENPRDREAWWAPVYGVAQSQTQLKQLSSSSSSNETKKKKNYFLPVLEQI